MDATDVGTILAAFVGGISDILQNNLPLVLGVAGALIGLGIVIRYVKRFVGRK